MPTAKHVGGEKKCHSFNELNVQIKCQNPIGIFHQATVKSVSGLTLK